MVRFNNGTGSAVLQHEYAPLGFAAGDANLYRYVGNSPTNFTDPSGLSPVGHHWVPSSVVDDAAIRPYLSDEAYHLQQGSYSGATRDAAGNGHRFGTYGGVTHGEYNKSVKEELTKYIKANNIQKMTPAQMDDFISKIQNGQNHAGVEHEKLKSFNDEIRKQTQAHIDHCKANGTRGGIQKAQTSEQRIKQGQSYMKRGDYIKLKVGAAVATVMGAFISEAKGAIDVASKSPNFRNAVGALSNGDVALADRYMLGAGNSRGSNCFQADLVDAGHGHAALEMEHQWAEAIKRGQERAQEAAKPHDKIPAPPLPDTRGFLHRQWDWLTDW